MSITAIASVDPRVDATAPQALPAVRSAGTAQPAAAEAELLAAGGLPAPVYPRADTIGYLRHQYDKGVAIYKVKIHYVEDLDDSRAKKLAWTQETTDLLTKVFAGSAVADFCNDWVGKIYPEYAEFGNFVEQFYEEMTHRLGRLREVLERLESHRSIEPAPAVQTMATAAPPPGVTRVSPPAAGIATAASAHPPAVEVVPSDRVLLGFNAESEPARQVAQFLEELGLSVMATEEVSACSPAPATESNYRFALLPTPASGADADAVFRLGYCAGRLGRQRVCLISLNATDGAAASNAFGLSQLIFDDGGGWRLELARLLKRAGFAVDLNRLC